MKPRHHRLLNRGAGLAFVAAGLAIVAMVYLGPIPEIEDLDVHSGTVVEARRERYRPCRRGDCTRTIVTVRHGGDEREYHFADVDTARFEVGAPITVWTYPVLRGTDRVRVWHAEQGGRVLREHDADARVDRRIRLAFILMVPLAIGGGAWIARNYDWRGRPARPGQR